MPVQPLAAPPESMRPDRPEVITSLGGGTFIDLSPGVRLECLVGESTHVRGLTTGIVTIQPGGRLPYHTHPYTESITLLKGKALTAIEGREYEMDLLDNIVIPCEVAHQIQNQSDSEPVVLHMSLASTTPTHDFVSDIFPRQAMLSNTTGIDGAERINRFKTAARFEAGPNTSFIDFFNETLMPGIEVSGGYGLFQPGGRLPSHVHDFDESICIIEGEATCIVEGRRYLLQDCATAMVPRGRVHYFINLSDKPMSMLWIYAGPSPIRIVVDERCATVEGNPWR